MFRDGTAEIIEAVVQVVLGLGFAALGIFLFVVSDQNAVAAWAWLTVLGGSGAAWATWSTRRAWRGVYRARSLRSAVPATATVIAVRPTGRYADEGHIRQYVDVDLMVTLPDAEPRPMRERAAMSLDQQIHLAPGATVAVHAHEVRPIVRIEWNFPV